MPDNPHPKWRVVGSFGFLLPSFSSLDPALRVLVVLATIAIALVVTLFAFAVRKVAMEKSAKLPTTKWRVGHKVPINVYEGDDPVCQCHTPEMAARIVAAMNELEAAQKENQRLLVRLRHQAEDGEDLNGD